MRRANGERCSGREGDIADSREFDVHAPCEGSLSRALHDPAREANVRVGALAANRAPRHRTGARPTQDVTRLHGDYRGPSCMLEFVCLSASVS